MSNNGDSAAAGEKVVPITTDALDQALIGVRAARQSFREIARGLDGPAFPQRRADVSPITTDEVALALISLRAARQDVQDLRRELREPLFPDATSRAPVAEEPVVAPPAAPNVIAFRPRSPAPETKTPA